jgi:hypothetical protein
MTKIKLTKQELTEMIQRSIVKSIQENKSKSKAKPMNESISPELISAIAGPLAIGAVSVGVNKLMDALNSGKFGEKGKLIANELAKLGRSANDATMGRSVSEDDLDQEY